MSLLVVTYLFLGGAGAGAALLLVLLDIRSPWASTVQVHPAANQLSSKHHTRGLEPITRFKYRVMPQREYKWLFGYGFLVSFALLALGVVCLLADLGRLDRVLLLFTLPTASYVTIGTYALALLALGSLALTAIWFSNTKTFSRWVIRVLDVVVALSAVVVMLYTGLLIQSMRTGLLTGSPFVTVLFVLSSLSLGIALVLAVCVCSKEGRRFITTARQLMNLDRIVIVLEALSAVAFVTYGLLTPAFTKTMEMMLSGSLSILFWLGFIVCGLIVPFIFESALCSKRIQKQEGQLSFLVTSAGILIGGFCLRWLIVLAV